jgi:hypothetical protein
MLRWMAGFVVFLFVFFLFYVSRPEFIEKVPRFTATDWAVLVSIPIALLATHFLSRWVRNSRLTSRDVLWLSILLVTLVLISALIFYVKGETGQAILLASYFASLGWIYTNYVAGHIQRKAHTMNVLIQLRNSTEFNKHRSLVLSKFPFGHPITVNDLPALNAERARGDAYGPDKVPILDSAYYIANYYEFISVGVMNGDLDGGLIQHTLRTILTNWFTHLEPIIYDAQVETNGSRNERVFRGYIELVKYYKSLPAT